MRAPLNRKCSFIRGVRSLVGTPGHRYVTGVPCRNVPQREIFQQQSPFHLSGAWVTFGGFEPTGPAVKVMGDGLLLTDYYAADMLTFEGDDSHPLVCCRQEIVRSDEGEPYARCLVIAFTSLASLPHYVEPPPIAVPPPGGGPFETPGGSSCMTAHQVATGVAFGGTISQGQDQWWRVGPLVPFVFYHMSKAITGAGAASASVALLGGVCGSQSGVGVSGTGACEEFLSPGEFLYVHATGNGTGDYQYILNITPGRCP